MFSVLKLDFGYGFELGSTWAPKAGKIIAQNQPKTAQTALILHTFGVQVGLRH